MVDHIYPPDQLMGEAARLAEQIASQSPAAVRAAKRALNMAMSSDLEAGLDFETTTAIGLFGGKTEE